MQALHPILRGVPSLRIKLHPIVKNICPLVFGILLWQTAAAQTTTPPQDTVSSFDKFNRKAEALFKIIPVPIITYSSEAGNIFGLAKFNLFHPSKKDTISRPSKLSEVVSFSTKGRVNVSVSNDLILHENKYMILSYFNYKKQPEYLLGIGNDVSLDNAEQVTINRIKFFSTAMVRVKKFVYAGIALDVADYFKVEADSNSFLIRDNVTGLHGGTDVGLGAAFALDSRDNRYNAYKGELLLATVLFYPEWLGSSFQFASVSLDARKYYNPWFKHVIAVQATTTYTSGDVPFYDLAQLGGEDKMRGYYKGALRDKVLFDAQIEYRMPVWNIFGITTWIGTGRVADQYNNLSLDGFRLSFGGGIRVRVDTKNNTNLRLDMGFGPGGVSGFYFNFAEAF
ncbi:Surface antigen [Chryseolinea serpens]|uniref:Surface antigen n=1 Tax=Chryseolinea serpens TaxID=947013 RepID=A0A1M5RGK8_9BACT|nr:BamA/TamA family outer membrane protein [Chryseolinea serpens]SHH25276.1 Surface antigen [Chryseolinea serpens]